MKYFLLLFCFVFYANAETPQEIAKKSFSSTVLLVMEDSSGNPLSLGSGFFVGKNEIVTNLHVIAGAAKGYAKPIGQKNKLNILGINALDSLHDLVILKVDDSDSPILNLGDSNKVQVGESVYAVGNPQGLEGTFSQGIVSSIRQIDDEKLLQITAPISPGSSGGPVLDQNGNVIGISVATFQDGQNLNFAIPVSYLRTMLDNTFETKSFSLVSKTEKSILPWTKSEKNESVEGIKFQWDGESKYSFSIHNTLRSNIKNTKYIVIFVDADGIPVDYKEGSYSSVLRAGLSTRVHGEADPSIIGIMKPFKKFSRAAKIEAAKILGDKEELEKLQNTKEDNDDSKTPEIKIRILDFEITNEAPR